jgi:glyceraldehyde-3-phosphate dehydrogenase (NADP+)
VAWHLKVVRSCDLISYTAEEGIRILAQGKFLVSDSFPGNERNKYCLESKIPLGVILAIPPFNYPVNLAVSKIAPALITGNAVILKPPTQVIPHIAFSLAIHSLYSCRARY